MTTRTVWLGVNGARDDQGGVWSAEVSADGGLARPARAAALENASFVARHVRAPVLYAVSEVEEGTVAVLAIRPGRELEPVAQIEVGANPCHLFVHPAGRWLYTANYADGTVVAMPLDEDGIPQGESLRLRHEGSGPVADRQEGPHAHSTLVSPGGGHLIVADLGSDMLWAHPLQDGRPAGEPLRTVMPAGFGPRHMLMRENTILVTGELGGQVATVAWDGSGEGRVTAVVPAATLPGGHQLSHLMEAGDDVIVGVRGADSLSQLTAAGGELALETEAGTVSSPRHMAVVGGHVLVAGQAEGALGIHQLTEGRLSPLRDRVPLPGAMFVLPDPA